MMSENIFMFAVREQLMSQFGMKISFYQNTVDWTLQSI